MTQTRSDLATIAAVAQLLAVVLAVAALFFARDVFVPLALGVLLSFLLSPVVNRLQRWGIPNVMAVVATATLAFLLLAGLFMLIHREDLRDRIIAVVSHGNYVTTTEALDEAAQRISRYLIAQTIINTSYGFVLSAGLAVIGATMTEEGLFPNVMLWGLLATCLRFVPYIGPVVSAIFALVIALSVFPGYGVALAVLALIITMELLSNNILEPWLYGASTGMSAVAVIIAAVFWGWLWGPVGILLSTPLTVCLVVIGRYVPRFKILSTLLGEEVELKTFMRFYQRMLATDEHRAWEILREHFDGSDINTTGDQVIVVLPKGGFAQARFLCRSIRGEGFTGPIVIACLGNFTYYDQLFVKFRKAGASSVTTSFSQTHAKIESILKRRENVTDIARQQLNPVVV